MAFFADSIAKCLQTLLQDNDQADLIVVIGREEILCHRFILSACSTYFRSLTRSGVKGLLNSSVFLRGVSVETFKQTLYILYTGENIITHDNMIDIWLAAHQLQIDFLLNKCESFIATKINWNNVFDIWQKADELKNHTLIKNCESYFNDNLSLKNYYQAYSHAQQENMSQILKNVKAFIIKNFEIISKDFVDKLSFEGLLEIVESHDLVVKSEDVVLDCILKWIECQPNDTAPPSQEKLVYLESDHIERFQADETVHTKIQFGKDKQLTDGNNCQSPVKPNMIKSIFLLKQYKTKDIKECEGALMKYDGSLPLHNSGCSGNSSTSLSQATANQSAPTHLLKTKTLPIAKRRDCKHEQLVKLLQTARLYLVSPDCLRKCCDHPAMEGNQAAKDIILDALANQTRSLSEGQTILGALHRKCSDLVNVVIFSHDTGFYALSVADGQCFTFQQCTVFKHNIQFVFFKGQLYAVGTDDPKSTRSKLCRFTFGYWPIVTEFDGGHLSLVAHDNCIHYFKPSSGEVFRIAQAVSGRKSYVIYRSAVFPLPTKIECVISFEGMLLVFCSEINEGQVVGNTAVYRVYPISREPCRLKSFPGPAQHVISFRGENKTFILQSNGVLWEIITTSGDLEFIFILQLWSAYEINLYGAVTANQVLYVFASKPTSDFKEKYCVTTTHGRFRSIFYYLDIEECDHSSNFISAILPKSCLRSL